MVILIKRFMLFASILLISEQGMAKDEKATKQSSSNDDAYTAIMSTKYDFGETNINGDTKGPDDFFLRGKQSQSLSQMVRLRSAFKRELRNSRYGVKALTK
jgi:hypothetical protein